jgi:Holliday junction resolvase RusA-like endonuclease
LSHSKIVVPGEPVPQARPIVVHNRYGAHGIDPPKSRAYKQLVKLYARQQWHEEPLCGPLRVTVCIYRSIQVSGSKALKQRKRDGVERPTVKPDVDNYYKAVSDALTGIVWQDDNQIVSIDVSKFYDDGGGPRVEIQVEEIKCFMNQHGL